MFVESPGCIPGVVGHSLIWPKQVCTTEQGMVFRALSLQKGIQFHYLVSLECVFGLDASKGDVMWNNWPRQFFKFSATQRFLLGTML